MFHPLPYVGQGFQDFLDEKRRNTHHAHNDLAAPAWPVAARPPAPRMPATGEVFV
eukprot:NODE_10160_length_315_cov_180.246154.p4 GENE.NODE_10160_length_315_cov_180.246154~~NODE_10160_length_315_cov_180.246154.p4  ORF type:complete len:55 (+),score=9.21 NODE_10160_length_315_cov_180.246154:104-268(+)